MENKEIIYNVKKDDGLPFEEIEKLMKQWQNKLEMTEWNLSLKIVEFHKKNGYRQSGDFIADPKKKEAVILMTNKPWRGDEEYTLVHEMLHILIYEYDKHNENVLLENVEKFGKEHDEYMNLLEKFVHHLTKITLGRSDR